MNIKELKRRYEFYIQHVKERTEKEASFMRHAYTKEDLEDNLKESQAVLRLIKKVEKMRK